MDSTLANLSLLSEDLPAIEDGNGLWTRGNLRRNVQAAAAYFRRNEIGVGDRVTVVTVEDKRVVAALLGARTVGALTCPIDRIEAVGHVERIKPRLCVATEAIQGIDTIDIDALFAEPGSPLSGPVEGASSAWGVNTSGSSGPPKTVILTEDSVAHVTAAVQELVEYKQDDRVHGALPLYHTYGLSQLWLAMASGACLYLPCGQPTRANLDRWLGGCTVLPTIATKLRSLLEIGARSNVRLITLAGQGADADTRALFAKQQPHSRFIHFYGLTEATTRVLWLGHDEFFQRPRATGRPIRGVRAWVEADGELWVEGPNVAGGYLDNPEATARRFPGGRLRTGDYFEADGDLFNYLGRLDGVFKRFGEKVIPERVEAALQSHPEVLQSLVTSEPGPGGEVVPVAWVVGRDEFSDGQSLIRHVRPRLPPVMVPVVVRFVSSLPTTTHGKLLRLAPEAPAVVLTETRVVQMPCMTDIEAWLREALAERLSVAPSAIEPTRHLAEYGLDSVGTVDLVAALGKKLGRTVSYSIVWTHPTLAALSGYLASEASGAGGLPLQAQPWTAPAQPRSPEAPVLISQLERRRLQLSRAAPEADGRSLWLSGEADGDFSPDVFRTAVNELAARHDVWRSHYSFSGDAASKVILPSVSIDVPLHDLTGQPEAGRRRVGLALLGDEVDRPFDLENAPLVKAVVVKLAEHRHLFAVAFDHVIADAASVVLTWSALHTMYAAVAARHDLPRRPALQYADFADWHEKLLTGSHAKRLKEHWERHLAGGTSPIPPVSMTGRTPDAPRSPFPSQSAFIDIPDAVSAAVRQSAIQHGCTQFVFYYGAFAVLLGRLSGWPDVTISSSYDFRSREQDLQDMLGMLTNTCALRLSLEGVATPADLLQRARTEVSRMIATSDLPPTLYPSTTAFDVLFNYAELGARTGTPPTWGGFTVRPLGRAALATNARSHMNIHDLLFVLRNHGGRLSGAVIANAELWSKEEVRRMANGYGETLRWMIEPDQPLSQLLSKRT